MKTTITKQIDLTPSELKNILSETLKEKIEFFEIIYGFDDDGDKIITGYRVTAINKN